MKNLWKKVYGTAVGTSVLVTPTLASAAGKEPAQLVQSIADGVSNFFLISAPSVGTAVFMGIGFMYLLSNDSHKKSEYKSHMKKTFIIVACIVSAGGFMKWFTNMI
ncbi:TPA: hypothetical protein ROY42_005646 [Bacillus thuringiensis]|nr:hypothetical protein [Bacillus thuringiensis]